jgi:hypothetical protein
VARKEIRIPHAEIKNPQTITQRQVRAFKENDLDIHKNEVDEIVDDFSTKTRILKIRKVKYFGPWSHRG